MKSSFFFLTLAFAMTVLPVTAQQNRKAATPAVPAAPSSELEQKIEARLGRPLTPDQKQRLQRTSVDHSRNLLLPHAKFIQDVAQAFNQTADIVAPMVPRANSPSESLDKAVAPKLEAKLARKLNPGELNRLKALDDGRKAQVKVQQDNYARQISAVVNLPMNAISEMLPK
jgi:hypothetical protein